MSTADEAPTSSAFLSYCHADKDVAIRLQAAFEAHGWTVFRDETDIVPGDDLPPVIAEAIDQADLFLVLSSADYASSRPCQWELNQAVARSFGDDQLRIIVFKLDDTPVPNMLRASLYVRVEEGHEEKAAEHALRERRNAEAGMQAPRTTNAEKTPETAEDEHHGAVREAVRYARELEALASIDARLVEAQQELQAVAASYDEAGYQGAYKQWQEAWVRLTLPVRDTELLNRIQAVGSLLSEVVLSDREPRQLRPWMVLRAIASARAAIGYALRGEPLPELSFPSLEELRNLLGDGDLLDDPIAPLRARLAELPPPDFHGPAA